MNQLTKQEITDQLKKAKDESSALRLAASALMSGQGLEWKTMDRQWSSESGIGLGPITQIAVSRFFKVRIFRTRGDDKNIWWVSKAEHLQD